MTFRSYRKKESQINEEELKRCLSKEKLDSYRSFIQNGSFVRAVNMYTVTQLYSSFLYLPLQFLEISLRNKIYCVLAEFYKKKTLPDNCAPERWLFWLPQSESVKSKISFAEKKANEEVQGRAVHIGDVISRISFGTWITLLGEQPNNKSPLHFWQKTASSIFPNAPKRTQVRIIHCLRDANNTRNRLFHYEPIWDTGNKSNRMKMFIDIERKFDKILEILGWISKDIVFMLEENGSCAFFRNGIAEAKKNLTGYFAP